MEESLVFRLHTLTTGSGCCFHRLLTGVRDVKVEEKDTLLGLRYLMAKANVIAFQIGHLSVSAPQELPESFFATEVKSTFTTSNGWRFFGELHEVATLADVSGWSSARAGIVTRAGSSHVVKINVGSRSAWYLLGPCDSVQSLVSPHQVFVMPGRPSERVVTRTEEFFWGSLVEVEFDPPLRSPDFLTRRSPETGMAVFC